MLVALVSAKGSPGVTTTALALAAATSARGSLLVEADPAGGDLECWCGPLGEPGLLGVATDLARDADAELIDSRAVEVVPGVRAVVAPTGESAATATIVPMAERLGPALATLDVPVLVDCGRWSVAHRAASQVAAASLVGVVCRPTLDSVEHTRDLVESLRRVNRAVAAVVVGGHRPYGSDEVSSALGVPVAGVLPWEPRAVLALLESGVARPWSRSGLAGAATECAAGLERIAAEVWSHA